MTDALKVGDRVKSTFEGYADIIGTITRKACVNCFIVDSKYHFHKDHLQKITNEEPMMQDTESKIKMGDRVKVKKNINKDKNAGGWSSHMDKTIGETGRVCYVFNDRVGVEFEAEITKESWMYSLENLEKITNEEPMMLQVDDTVKVKEGACKATQDKCDWNPRMNKTKGQIGKVWFVNNENTVAAVEFSDGNSWKYAVEDLEKIDKPAMQINNLCKEHPNSLCKCLKLSFPSELKLEVGKKYDIPDSNYSPCIYLCDIRQYGFKSESPYHFLDCDGDPNELTEEDLKDIKEHREPYKHSGTYYLAYDPNEHLIHREEILSEITNKFAIGIYHTKDEAKKKNKSIARVEIQTTVFEEPND